MGGEAHLQTFEFDNSPPLLHTITEFLAACDACWLRQNPEKEAMKLDTFRSVVRTYTDGF
jgi:hypothetical protein